LRRPPRRKLLIRLRRKIEFETSESAAWRAARQ
jgi:hypothetical protein